MNRSRVLSMLAAATLGATALTGVAIAQQAPGPPGARPHKPQTREEAVAKADRHFARTDTDRNGSISQAEHRAAALARFQREDTNNDGRIDEAERRAMHQKRMKRRAGPGRAPETSIHEPHTGG